MSNYTYYTSTTANSANSTINGGYVTIPVVTGANSWFTITGTGSYNGLMQDFKVPGTNIKYENIKYVYEVKRKVVLNIFEYIVKRKLIKEGTIKEVD